MPSTMTITDPDELSVATIRTLAMDAVQAANSGHPGTPIALAPVAYTLWQEFLRFDPEQPIWANRDRFVLSAGHASTLLYSLLHLTGVQSVNPKYETLGEPSVSLDDLQAVPAAGLQVPRAPGVPVDRRGGVHHRPAGHRVRHQRRHGDGLASGRRRRSTAPASSCSTTTSTPSAATAA